MHIVMAILGVLGTAAFIFWRIHIASQAARDLADLAGEAANLPRKMRFRSKANRRAVETIDDPREAAAVLIFGVAACAGPITEPDRAAMTHDMARLFGISEADATELAARAAWHVSGMVDPLNAVNRLTDIVVENAGNEALSSLSPVLQASAARTEMQSADQSAFIAKFRRRAGLA
ncbi:hypothetical protein [Glycocaulis alkaliphilus]|nr:hypothetical protein [Glycocaulis alkaliphilus]GGB80687.1 hypothetical protein GCM10007417_20760 [Glycocaulis alkaliphilus]